VVKVEPEHELVLQAELSALKQVPEPLQLSSTQSESAVQTLCGSLRFGTALQVPDGAVH
jgi:hypothetical protein